MTEFWFISVPGENNPDQAYIQLTSDLNRLQMSTQCKFNIPNELKVGTLDVLVGLSEDLQKLDTYTEGITRKIVHYMGEVLENQKNKLPDNLTVGGVDPATYISQFRWDTAKYPVKLALRALYDIVAEQVSKTDNDLKHKSAAYNSLRNSLLNLEKKQTGSLLTRTLVGIVKKEQFITDSESLVTLVVVVPKTAYNEWLSKYEKLCDMVVPRSSEKIFEDSEHGLWTVTIFIKKIDDFKKVARENRFTVRDFTFDEQQLEDSRMELSNLEGDKRKNFGPLFRWLKINFGETFAALIHIKAMRVFIESVLRYGLPVNFLAITIQPNKKSEKRVRELLNSKFKHLDTYNSSSGGAGWNALEDEAFGQSAMAAVGVHDYHAYVSFKVDSNMID